MRADTARDQPFLVVGVGASAGGLEAFRELLEHLPPEPGLALLFVQHLDPSRPSMLQDLLGKMTGLTVRQADQGLRLEPDSIYVIPPAAEMAVKDGQLVLSPRPARSAHMPIDHLFRSLAEDLKSRAVGVILSGGGTDGALGLDAIKAEGGLTFAQDEKTARHDSMPRSAAAHGSVDYVLPPAGIARKLAGLARHPYPAHPEPPGPPPGDDREAIEAILALLRANTDVDFTLYKRTTIVRRIRRRMALRGLESARDYLRLVQNDPGEVQNLYQDLLIRVTRFFRDEEVYAALRETVFPNLIKDRSANRPVRLWVAGCSTGEEVYSLAISLLEFLSEHGSNIPIKILATDVNEAALERARAGIYIDNIAMDVSPERLRRFFGQVNGNYQIGKAVRDLCIFSKHDLTRDPPFSRLDLVSCRNVLIYLDAALQKRVMPVLHYALNPGGYLVLGSSETIGSFTDLFAGVDARHRIYTRNPGGLTGLPLDYGPFVGTLGAAGHRTAAPPVPWTAQDVQREADRVVLARYAPVGVVIDESLTVVQFRGRTGPYLEPAPGLATLDLLKMLREGLLGEVRAAVLKAKTENVAVRKDGLPVRDGAQTRLVDVEVLPIKVPPSGVRCFLVLFHEAGELTPAPPAPPEAPPAGTPADGSLQLIGQLQQELTATREYLQSLVEEHESTCEELKSASEEILSSNEELQSTNEELQTAKEETQSSNEELVTLNEELHHRNVELAQVNNDLVNLLGAVMIPILFVDRNLRVRRFTPTAETALNLIPTDVGRPISDIKSNLNVPDLAGLIARVIDTLTPLATEVQDRAGHWFSLRIRPYVTLDNKIDGATITLLDVDALKRGLEQGQRPAVPPPAGAKESG